MEKMETRKLTMEETAKALEMLTMVSLYNRTKVGTSVSLTRMKEAPFYLVTIFFDEKPYYFHVSEATVLTRPMDQIVEGLVNKVEELSKIRSAN